MRGIALALPLVLAFIFAVSRPALAIDDPEWDRVIETRSARDTRKRELDQLKSSIEQVAQLVRGVRADLEGQRKAIEETEKAHTGVQAIQDARGELKLDDPALQNLEKTKELSETKPIADALVVLESEGGKALEALKKVTSPPAAAAEVSAVKPIVDGLTKALDTLKDVRARLAKIESGTTVTAAAEALAQAETAYKDAQVEYRKTSKPARTLGKRLWPSRRLRCLTAYCFGGGDGTKFGIEPVLDLPFGVVWSSGGGALRSYVNSHTFNIEFNAGLRYWFAYDTASVMVYLSRPVIESKDPIQVSGSPFLHEPSAIRRPYPSIGVGLFGDVLLLGVSLDELRNGTTDQSRDPRYPAGEVLSRSLTFSLGFSIVNTARNTADTAAAKALEGGK